MLVGFLIGIQDYWDPYNLALLCTQRNRGYSHCVQRYCKRNQQLPMVSKCFLAINGKFSYDCGSKDAHDRSRCWGDVLQLFSFPGTGKLLRSGFGILSGAQKGPSRNTSLDALGMNHDGYSFVSLCHHTGHVMGK